MFETKKLTVFYFNKIILFLIIILMILIYLSISTLTGSLGLSEKLKNVSLVMIDNIAWVILFVCGIMAYRTVDNFMYSIMNFVIDDKGITINNDTNILWEKVEDIEYTTIKGFKHIKIRIEDKYAEKLMSVSYFLNDFFVSTNELCFNASNFNVSGKKIFETMQDLRSQNNISKVNQ